MRVWKALLIFTVMTEKQLFRNFTILGETGNFSQGTVARHLSVQDMEPGNPRTMFMLGSIEKVLDDQASLWEPACVVRISPTDTHAE